MNTLLVAIVALLLDFSIFSIFSYKFFLPNFVLISASFLYVKPKNGMIFLYILMFLLQDILHSSVIGVSAASYMISSFLIFYTFVKKSSKYNRGSDEIFEALYTILIADILFYIFKIVINFNFTSLAISSISSLLSTIVLTYIFIFFYRYKRNKKHQILI